MIAFDPFTKIELKVGATGQEKAAPGIAAQLVPLNSSIAQVEDPS